MRALKNLLSDLKECYFTQMAVGCIVLAIFSCGYVVNDVIEEIRERGKLVYETIARFEVVMESHKKQ